MDGCNLAPVHCGSERTMMEFHTHSPWWGIMLFLHDLVSIREYVTIICISSHTVLTVLFSLSLIWPSPSVCWTISEWVKFCGSVWKYEVARLCVLVTDWWCVDCNTWLSDFIAGGGDDPSPIKGHFSFYNILRGPFGTIKQIYQSNEVAVSLWREATDTTRRWWSLCFFSPNFKCICRCDSSSLWFYPLLFIPAVTLFKKAR